MAVAAVVTFAATTVVEMTAAVTVIEERLTIVAASATKPLIATEVVEEGDIKIEGSTPQSKTQPLTVREAVEAALVVVTSTASTVANKAGDLGGDLKTTGVVAVGRHSKKITVGIMMTRTVAAETDRKICQKWTGPNLCQEMKDWKRKFCLFLTPETLVKKYFLITK